MSVPPYIAGEIYQRLERIGRFVKEVEANPNFGPDVWPLKEGDQKCRQICADASWVEQMVRSYLGTGAGSILSELGGPCGRVG